MLERRLSFVEPFGDDTEVVVRFDLGLVEFGGLPQREERFAHEPTLDGDASPENGELRVVGGQPLGLIDLPRRLVEVAREEGLHAHVVLGGGLERVEAGLREADPLGRVPAVPAAPTEGEGEGEPEEHRADDQA